METEANPNPESGNITVWLSCFKICTKANGWSGCRYKAVKLPTILEGKKLAVWLGGTFIGQPDVGM